MLDLSHAVGLFDPHGRVLAWLSLLIRRSVLLNALPFSFQRNSTLHVIIFIGGRLCLLVN
jgi:hypothetical protein